MASAKSLRQQQQAQRQINLETQRRIDRQLQQRALLRGVSQQQIKREQEVARLQQQQKAEQKAQEEVNKEIESFNSGINFSNYEAKYNELSSDAKKYVKSPTEIKQTSEYKQYQAQQKQILQQKQLNLAVKVYLGQVSGSYSGFKAIPESIKKQAEKIAYEHEQVGGIISKSKSAEAIIKNLESKGLQLSDTAKENIMKIQKGEKVESLGGRKVDVDLTRPTFQSNFEFKIKDVFTKENIALGKEINRLKELGYNTQDILKISFETGKTGESLIQELKNIKTVKFDESLIQELKNIKTVKVDTSINKVLLKEETQKFEELGYTKSDAKILAIESSKQGGIDFSKETAQRIIQGESYSDIVRDNSIGGTRGLNLSGSGNQSVQKVNLTRESYGDFSGYSGVDIGGLGMFSTNQTGTQGKVISDFSGTVGLNLGGAGNVLNQSTNKSLGDFTGTSGLDIGGFGKQMFSVNQGLIPSLARYGGEVIDTGVKYTKKYFDIVGELNKPQIEMLDFGFGKIKKGKSVAGILGYLSAPMPEEEKPKEEKKETDWGAFSFLRKPEEEIKKEEEELEKFNVIRGVSNVFWGGVKLLDKPYEKTMEIFNVPENSLLRTKVKITPELYDVPGKTALWVGFSPLMQTGTSAELSKQLSKNKFNKLEDFYAKVSKDLVKKKSAEEQTKYLIDLAKKVNLKNSEQVAGFRQFVQNLYQQGFYKGIPVKTATRPTTKILIDITGNLPVSKGFSYIGAGITSIPERQKTFVEPQKFRQVDLSGMGMVDLSGTKQRQAPIVFTKQNIKQLQGYDSKLDNLTKQVSISSAIQLSKLGSLTKTITKQKQKTKIRGIMDFRHPEIEKTKPPKPIILPLLEERKMLPKKEDKRGYDVYIKEKGKNKKITKKPILKSRALDLMAYGLDRSLSATGFIKKSKKKASPVQFKIPQGYYLRNIGKFRNYQVRKGTKRPLKNTFIEKRTYRLDTPSEVRKIQVSRLLAGRKIKKSKKRKSKKNNKFKKRKNIDITGYDKNLKNLI